MLKSEITKQSKDFAEIYNSLPLPQDKETYIYNIETYIFSPKSLDVTPQTYSKSDFYKSFKNYIRFHISRVSWDEILNEKGAFFELEHLIHGLFGELSDTDIQHIQEHLKIFSINIDHALNEQKRIIKKSLKNSLTTGDTVREYLTKCTLFLQKYRELKNKVRHEITISTDEEKKFFHKNTSLLQIMEFCENYILLKIRYHSSLIIDMLIAKNIHEMLDELALFIDENDHYMVNELKAPIPSSKYNDENFTKHYKLLQRYITNVLFLHKYTQADIEIGKQLIFSFAAGLSMVVATTIAFVWQSKYGSLSVPVFIALVFGYMLKDRVKEFMKETGAKWLVDYFWDYRRKLLKDDKNKVGSYTESFRHLDSYEKLENDIRILIKQTHKNQLYKVLPEANIMYYKKIIKIDKGNHELFGKRFRKTIFDIDRFSLKPFFLKSEQSSGTLWYNYDKESNSNKIIDVLKTYDIVIICKYSRNKEVKLLKKFIITIGKNKVQKIQTII